MILDAREYRQQFLEMLKDHVSFYKLEGKVAIIQVGNRQDSNKYINNKVKYLNEVGLDAEVFKFDEDVKETEILSKIEELNFDNKVVGVMVQLPLPKGMNEELIVNYVTPEKDIDCLTYTNLGRLYNKNMTVRSMENEIIPATPKGIVRLLDFYDVKIAGRKVCIVGRSNIVGKPLATILTNLGATVTICNSSTEFLSNQTHEADIVVTAIGKAKFFNKYYFNCNATVVDVGINLDENGKLCGDVDFESVSAKVKNISPVPNGVGIMTVCSLLENAVILAERKARLERGGSLWKK